MTEANEKTTPTIQETSKPQAKKKKELAEYKYIGDDGARFVFERRSDKRVVTFDKPANLPPGNPSQFRVVGTVHGYRVNEQMIALCKK